MQIICKNAAVSVGNANRISLQRVPRKRAYMYPLQNQPVQTTVPEIYPKEQNLNETTFFFFFSFLLPFFPHLEVCVHSRACVAIVSTYSYVRA